MEQWGREGGRKGGRETAPPPSFTSGDEEGDEEEREGHVNKQRREEDFRSFPTHKQSARPPSHPPSFSTWPLLRKEPTCMGGSPDASAAQCSGVII